MKKCIFLMFALGLGLATSAQQAPRTVGQEVQLTLGLRPILGYAIQPTETENSLYMPVRFEPNKSPFAHLDFRIFSSVPYDYTVSRKVIPGRLYEVTCSISEK
jgi:hypothetical protein